MSVWSPLISADGLVAMMVLAYGAKLRRRDRPERLIVAGEIYIPGARRS